MTETLDFLNADEQGNCFYSMTFIYGVFRQQRRGIDGNGVASTSFLFFCLNGGKPSPEAPLLSCCCHGYETLQKNCGLIFRWYFPFEYLYFDTVLVSIEKKGNMEPIVFI